MPRANRRLSRGLIRRNLGAGSGLIRREQNDSGQSVRESVRSRLREIAAVRRRFSYRRLYSLPGREGIALSGLDYYNTIRPHSGPGSPAGRLCRAQHPTVTTRLVGG
jgi:hypothetical protein